MGDRIQIVILMQKRFFPFELQDLIQPCQKLVREYVRQFSNVYDIANAIIREIKYPFHLGVPDDTHIYNAYHGKWCKVIEIDYWDTAEEVLGTKLADCDGSSICFVTCLRAFGVSASRVYEVFGVVKDYRTDQILGGHAWSIFENKGWRLYESTLDRPPSEYPEIPSPYKPSIIGNVKYEPDIIFNDKLILMSKEYHRKNETHEKYELIAEAWNIETKPHLEFHKIKNRILRFILRR